MIWYAAFLPMPTITGGLMTGLFAAAATGAMNLIGSTIIAKSTVSDKNDILTSTLMLTALMGGMQACTVVPPAYMLLYWSKRLRARGGI